MNSLAVETKKPVAANREKPYTIVFVSAEVAPFSKTGGLGEVLSSLPVALAKRGHKVAVFTPMYDCSKKTKQPIRPLDVMVNVPVGKGQVSGRVCQSTLPGSDVPVYLIEHEDYFERDEKLFGHTIYQFKSTEGPLRDYPDNDSRFVFFQRAVLDALHKLDLTPDIIHINDWQTGLIPIYMRYHYSWDRRIANARSVFTIHNLAYQGRFGKGAMDVGHLGWEFFTHHRLEHQDTVSFMKAGIVFSDAITTVSKRYAQEIQGSEFGEGLDGNIRAQGFKLFGINNGVDYDVWNPEVDKLLAHRYGPANVTEGKTANKLALQAQVGLAQKSNVPLLGMVTRLAEQKGIKLVMDACWQILGMGAQLVVLGTGDREYENFFRFMGQRFPQQVAALIQFDENLAHRIMAASDMFLMPSRFEPSGLNQLYSLKYGTIPIVRETGGLSDTVSDCNEHTWKHGKPTGFNFEHYTAEGLMYAVRRAIDCYHNAPEVWHTLQQNGMAQDWSWERGAKGYEEVYRKVLANR